MYLETTLTPHLHSDTLQHTSMHSHAHACTHICMHIHTGESCIVEVGGRGGKHYLQTRVQKQVDQELTADPGVFIRDACSHLCSYSCVCALKSVAALCSPDLPHQSHSVLFQCCWYRQQTDWLSKLVTLCFQRVATCVFLMLCSIPSVKC